jgi:hypothetical protein
MHYINIFYFQKIIFYIITWKQNIQKHKKQLIYKKKTNFLTNSVTFLRLKPIIYAKLIMSQRLLPVSLGRNEMLL